MQYITDVREAKEIDRMTIQEIGIPSMVLMEKAALAVAGCVKSMPHRKAMCWQSAVWEIMAVMGLLLQECCGRMDIR